MSEITKNLKVTQFSLKQILENLDKIPKDGGARFGHDQEKLSPQQKRDLMEKVRKFNEYGKVLRCETALMEMSTTLAEIGKMAESYAMTESGDYFQAETVKRDFNDVKRITKDFSKLARESYGNLQQLNALYEDMGRKMERYFEIASLDEIAAATPQIGSAPAPVVGEIAQEEEEGYEEEGMMNEGLKKKSKVNESISLIESVLSSKTTSTEKVIRGETPKYPAVLKKFLQDMPVNATLIFYDGRKKYYSGTMPYLAIKKEFSNVLNGVAYREHDNRRQIFGQPIPESDIGRLVDAIHRQSNPAVGASILNTFVLQYNRNAAQQSAPAAIAPPEKPDMSNLKRIRQIKLAKAKKFSKHKEEPKEPQEPS